MNKRKKALYGVMAILLVGVYILVLVFSGRGQTEQIAEVVKPVPDNKMSAEYLSYIAPEFGLNFESSTDKYFGKVTSYRSADGLTSVVITEFIDPETDLEFTYFDYLEDLGFTKDSNGMARSIYKENQFYSQFIVHNEDTILFVSSNSIDTKNEICLKFDYTVADYLPFDQAQGVNESGQLVQYADKPVYTTEYLPYLDLSEESLGRLTAVNTVIMEAINSSMTFRELQDKYPDVFYYQKENAELQIESGEATYMLIYVYVPELDGFINIILSGRNFVHEPIQSIDCLIDGSTYIIS